MEEIEYNNNNNTALCQIKFETKLNNQAAQSLARTSIKRLWWAYVLLSLIWIVVGVINIVNPDEPDVAFGITLIVVGVLFTPVCIAITFAVVNRNNKKMPLLSDETTETYVFTPDFVTLTQRKGSDYESTMRARYNCFNKVVSTSTHYYVYLSAQQCHVISKRDLVEGSLSDLDDIFARNFGAAFVRK